MDYYLIINIITIVFIPITGVYLVPKILERIYKKVPNYIDKINEAFIRDKSNKKEEEDIFDEEDKKKFIIDVKAGSWIGIFERTLIIIFLILERPEAVALIVTIKGLARYKQMENKILAEYYLLGTFISVLYGIGGFYAIRYIGKFIINHS